jgi:hypothetical protein
MLHCGSLLHLVCVVLVVAGNAQVNSNGRYKEAMTEKRLAMLEQCASCNAMPTSCTKLGGQHVQVHTGSTHHTCYMQLVHPQQHTATFN